MKSKISKKELRQTLEISIYSAMERTTIAPSKKLIKVAGKVAKKLAQELNAELKNLSKEKRSKRKSSPTGIAREEKATGNG